MDAFLPPEILELFAPREPIPYLPPVTKLSHMVKRQPYAGVGNFDGFEDPKDTPPPTLIETREQRLARKKQEQAEQAAYKLEQELASWDPHNIPEGTSDALKTLFLARLNHETTEAKLRSEFESYGTIKKIVMIYDKKSGKPRGYAFIEYDHERDMHIAYKRAHGIKIDGNRLIVDVERSRTVKGWLPKRLGGGISTKKDDEEEEVNDRHSGRNGSRHDSREKEYPKRRERERVRERERSSSRTRTRERRRSKDYHRDAKRRSRDRDKENDKYGSDEDRKDYRDKRKDRDDKRDVQREIRDRRRRSRSRDRKRSQRSRSKSKDREQKPRRRFTEYEKDKEPLEVVIIKSEPSSDSD